MTVEQKIARSLPGKARLLAALSGGPDSVALTVALCRLRQDTGSTVGAAHFHHGLRGTEADSDEQFCQTLCQSLHIPLYIGRGDVRAAPTGKGEEADGRVLRYDFLQDMAAKNGYTHVVTAHTADDNAETLLLNLVRGTGLDGLTGIPLVRDNILRPMLECTREEVEAYLSAQGVSWRIDASNYTDAYRRNRLRRHVMPLLKEENPNLLGTLQRTVTILAQDAGYLNQQAAALLPTLRTPEGAINAQTLYALPPSLSARVIKRLIGDAMGCPGVDIAKVHIDGILRLCAQTKGSGKVDLPHGLTARRRYDMLQIQASVSPADLPEMTPVKVTYGSKIWIPQWGLMVHWQKKAQKVHNLVYSFVLRSDIIGCILQVRSRKPGDRIKLLGRNGTKSLQDLFVDAKLPKEQRACIPVICDAQGVIAVGGFGVASRGAPPAGDGGSNLLFYREELPSCQQCQL